MKNNLQQLPDDKTIPQSTICRQDGRAWTLYSDGSVRQTAGFGMHAWNAQRVKQEAAGYFNGSSSRDFFSELWMSDMLSSHPSLEKAFKGASEGIIDLMKQAGHAQVKAAFDENHSKTNTARQAGCEASKAMEKLQEAAKLAAGAEDLLQLAENNS